MKTYRDYNYIVYYANKLGHFNGYVRLPDNHPYNKLVDKIKTNELGSFHTGYDDMNIYCHGGLTFSRRITKDDIDVFPQGFSEGAWIGWDYAHAGDKLIFPEEIMKIIKKIRDEYKVKFLDMPEIEDKEWTFEEVEEECKNVINQLSQIK